MVGRAAERAQHGRPRTQVVRQEPVRFGAEEAVEKRHGIGRHFLDILAIGSYRENVEEMPAYAVAFLDRFLGAEPNWLLPDDLRSRPAMLRALGGPSDHSSRDRLSGRG